MRNMNCLFTFILFISFSDQDEILHRYLPLGFMEELLCYSPDTFSPQHTICPVMSCSPPSNHNECCNMQQAPARGNVTQLLLCEKDRISNLQTTRDCNETDLRYKATSPMNWHESECCVEETSPGNTRTCCLEPSTNLFTCSKQESRPPSPLRCDRIQCPKEGCVFNETLSICCQLHLNASSTLTCCSPSPESRMRDEQAHAEEDFETTIDPCLPRPVSTSLFTCYNRNDKEAATYKCPQLQCSHDEYEPRPDGNCCAINTGEVKWSMCWDKGQAIFSSTSSGFPKLQECSVHDKCEITKHVQTEWLGKGCCELMNGPYPKTCCKELDKYGNKSIACYPLVTLKPDYVQCHDFPCRETNCYLQGSDVQCCEHTTSNEVQTCCINNPIQGIARPPKFGPGLPTKIKNILPNLDCYPSSQKAPAYLPCPELQCLDNINETLGSEKTQKECCTFFANGVTWICCPYKGCTKSVEERNLPLCRQTQCRISSKEADNIKRNGCCEDVSFGNFFTCCTHVYGDGDQYVQCVPREVKVPDYLTCSMFTSDHEKFCEILHKHDSEYCCTEPSIDMTCCLTKSSKDSVHT